MADAMEAAGQHVDEKAADELIDGEGHQLKALAALRAIILPAEGHTGIVERNEPTVGDGAAVGVAREVGQYCFGSAERAFAVDDPFRVAQRREVGGEGIAFAEMSVLTEELQVAGIVGGEQLLQAPAAEQSREDADGEEEAWAAADPALPVERDAAARHDDVDMGVMRHGRAPAVQDGGEADASAEMPGVGGDGDECLCSGPEQDAVYRCLVLVSDVGDGCSATGR